MKLRVVLNGTNENPWHKMGLTQNPFPQIATAELTTHCLRLQSLGGAPIPDEAHIRAVLTGWSKEFIDLCCAKYVRGKLIEFEVIFEANS